MHASRTGDCVHLLSRWPAYRTSLEVVSQPADHGCLVPYGALAESLEESLPDALFAELASRSVVYDGILLNRHRCLLTDRWRAFAVLANSFCHGFDSLHGHRNVRMGSEGCKLGVLPGSFAFWWRPGAFAVHPTRIPAPEADSPVFGESWIYRSWWQSG